MKYYLSFGNFQKCPKFELITFKNPQKSFVDHFYKMPRDARRNSRGNKFKITGFKGFFNLLGAGTQFS